MKSLFLFFGSILLVASCHNSATVSNEYVADSLQDMSNISDAYLIATDSDTTRILPYDHTFHQNTDGFLLPKGGRAHKLDGRVYKKAKINTEIYVDRQIDDQFVADTTVVSMVNTILDELYFGVELSVEVAAGKSPNGTILQDLSSVNTDDTVNVENIVDILRAAGTFDKDKQLHIYLFDRSSFFKTANAIAFASEDHKFIFGSAYLFKNPMLFVHELGHVLGLNHSTAADSLGICYNVMHESSIGCANHVHPRQSLVVASGHLTPYFEDNAVLFPIGVTCDCESESIYDTKLQKYMNSIDRGIGDEELVGHVRILDDALSNIDNLPPEFERNFRRQAEIFLDPSDVVLIDTFVQWSIESQIALRKNNLLRLTAATIDKLHPTKNNTLYQVMEEGSMTVSDLRNELDTVSREYDPSTFYESLDTNILNTHTELRGKIIELQATVRKLQEENRNLKSTLDNSVVLDLKCDLLYKEGTQQSQENYRDELQQILKNCQKENR